MVTSKQREWCPYAAVCSVSLRGLTSTGTPPALQTASDLLLAIAQHQLHVFARRADRVSSSCPCHGSEFNQLQGFVCPHLTAYDDVTHALTIPIDSITQVCMTYRTATSAASTGSGPTTNSKGVATRTKDLVLRTTASLMLWLEFEHNLARGWFLEALTASAASAATPFEVDYLDLSDTSAIDSITTDASAQNITLAEVSAESLVLSAPSPLAFLRDAWRHVMYDKVKLALQVAQDIPTAFNAADDATVAGLLTTAMELSTRLDEPDVEAFALLTSGFLHLRDSTNAKHELALEQVLYSLKLSRENSLEYLTCLALQCAATVYLATSETLPKARELLTEATKLLTLSRQCAAMEPAMKMQFHAMLRTVSSTETVPRPSIQRAHSVLATGPVSLMNNSREKLLVIRSDSSSKLLDKTEKKGMAFNLWTHVFGSGSSNTRSATESDTIKLLLLSRVPKPLQANGQGGSFYVDVLGAHGVTKARFRVFFDAVSTIAWLQDHLTTRYQALVSLDQGEHDPVVELFYDPHRKELVPKHIVVSQWLPTPLQQSQYTLHAKLAPRIVSSHRTSTTASPIKSVLTRQASKADESPEGPSVLCSLCGQRIPLSDVEDHSETCF